MEIEEDDDGTTYSWEAATDPRSSEKAEAKDSAAPFGARDKATPVDDRGRSCGRRAAVVV